MLAVGVANSSAKREMFICSSTRMIASCEARLVCLRVGHTCGAKRSAGRPGVAPFTHLTTLAASSSRSSAIPRSFYAQESGVGESVCSRLASVMMGGYGLSIWIESTPSSSIDSISAWMMGMIAFMDSSGVA